jgi:hypothetical protein
MFALFVGPSMVEDVPAVEVSEVFHRNSLCPVDLGATTRL